MIWESAVIREDDRSAILKVARKYHASAVILFGSSVNREDAEDIDVGVRGIDPEAFFDLYGELLLCLSKPVDVVNLDKRSRFAELVENEGIVLDG